MINFQVLPASAVYAWSVFFNPGKTTFLHPFILICPLSLRVFISHGFSLPYLREEDRILEIQGVIPHSGSNGGWVPAQFIFREGVTPTRFPSVRHKPLGELSMRDYCPFLLFFLSCPRACTLLFSSLLALRAPLQLPCLA
jgi:hypothetical protein